MPIGLIAGNGTFPFLVLRAARQLGHDVTVVAISRAKPFPDLETLARDLGETTFALGPARPARARASHLSRPRRVSRAVMAGQVKHVKLFGGVMPDLTLLAVLRRLQAKNTDALIAARRRACSRSTASR